MQHFLLAFHFVLAFAIIGLVLLQKHDSDGALGSSGGGAASGMFSVRGQANLLTRTTAILMVFFIINCLILGRIHKHKAPEGSLIDKVEADVNAPILPRKQDMVPEVPPKASVDAQKAVGDETSSEVSRRASAEAAPEPVETATSDEALEEDGTHSDTDETAPDSAVQEDN
ncbi:MAG: preprotein translocase subunit SecG [Holosporaceae bacterium]|jgi:preprotein translocase subunit SecG|nr:preprotein translocase subunit SecG [Holosporaceae bacterium]